MQIAIAITKKCAFRDSVQEFTNVYHYATVGAQAELDLLPDAAYSSLISTLVTAEKIWHSAQVTFVRARVWSSGGTVAENHTLYMETLSGVGSASVGAAVWDQERAILVQWPAGVDSLGRKVYLRKWYHICGNSFGTAAIPAAASANTASMSSTIRGQIATQVDSITRIGVAEEWGLVAESGRERDGGAPVAHKFVEHHQLGDQWRIGT